MRRVLIGIVALAGTLLLSACAKDLTPQQRAFQLGTHFNQMQNFAISAIDIAKPSANIVDGIVAANDAAAPLVKDCIKQTFNIPINPVTAADVEAAATQQGLAKAACDLATGKVGDLSKLVGAEQ